MKKLEKLDDNLRNLKEQNLPLINSNLNNMDKKLISLEQKIAKKSKINLLMFVLILFLIAFSVFINLVK